MYRVLVIDREPFSARLLQELCELAGYGVVVVQELGQAAEQAVQTQPDLLILDASSKNLQAREVVSEIRTRTGYSELPVLLISSSPQPSRKADVEHGIVGFITRPFRANQIQATIEQALSARRPRSSLPPSGAVEPVDALTHEGTPQQLQVTLTYEYSRSERYGHPISCIVVRLMNLGAIVRDAGQNVLDGVVVQLASGLHTCIRGIDHLFRAGPGEFVVLLPETGAEGARVVVDRIEGQIADDSLWGGAVAPRPQLQLGCSTHPGREVSQAQDLLTLARKSLTTP